jgi:hypothetical protein
MSPIPGPSVSGRFWAFCRVVRFFPMPPIQIQNGKYASRFVRRWKIPRSVICNESRSERETYIRNARVSSFPPVELMRNHYLSSTLFLLFVFCSGCASTSRADVRLPDGTHCRSESTGFFLWPATGIACVDKNGTIVGSYSAN